MVYQHARTTFRFLRHLEAPVAWFGLYCVIGDMLASIIARHVAPFCLFYGGPAPSSCVPELSLFDGIETRCANPAFDTGWLLLIGIPQLAMIPVGMTAPILIHLPSNHANAWDWIDLASFAGASVPSVAVFITAIRFWVRSLPWLGAGVACLTVADVIAYVIRSP